MKIERFEDIRAWQLAEDLVVEVYRIEFRSGGDIDMGIKDQIRRASISIMSNIAEGFERGSNREFVKFLYFAKGSCGEVRSLLHIAHRIGYIETKVYSDLVKQAEDISKTISGFIKYLSTH